MLFGYVGKRPELDYPFTADTANKSWAASTYPTLSTHSATVSYNATYSEYGESSLRTTSATTNGVRVSNWGTTIKNNIGGSGSITNVQRILVESWGSNGNHTAHYNYTGVFDGTYYQGIGVNIGFNNSTPAVELRLWASPTPIDPNIAQTNVLGTWYTVIITGNQDYAIGFINGNVNSGTQTNTGAFGSGYNYDGFGLVGSGGVNPVGTGVMRRKYCFQFDGALTRQDMYILHLNNGRVKL